MQRSRITWPVQIVYGVPISCMLMQRSLQIVSVYDYVCIYSSVSAFVTRRGQHLLFSYHGIPREVSWTAGDPYACLCFQTTRLVAQRLGLKVLLLLRPLQLLPRWRRLSLLPFTLYLLFLGLPAASNAARAAAAAAVFSPFVDAAELLLIRVLVLLLSLQQYAAAVYSGLP